MPLIELTVQHGRTLDDARRRLEAAVGEISHRFGALVRRVDWAQDRSQVTVAGMGFWIEMRIDDRAVHVKADVPILGSLVGAPLASGLKQILQGAFSKLPR